MHAIAPNTSPRVSSRNNADLVTRAVVLAPPKKPCCVASFSSTLPPANTGDNRAARRLVGGGGVRAIIWSSSSALIALLNRLLPVDRVDLDGVVANAVASGIGLLNKCPNALLGRSGD
jgi:hypothetical protein